MRSILSGRSAAPQPISTQRNTPRELATNEFFHGDTDFLDFFRKVFRCLIEENSWQDKTVNLTMRKHSDQRNGQFSEENDHLLEADFQGSKGQAFACAGESFSAVSRKLAAIGDMKADGAHGGAVFLASLNAVARHLGIVDRTQHCTGADSTSCATELVSLITRKHGNPRVALIGAHSAMIEALARKFELRVTDTDGKTAGTSLWGIPVLSSKHTLDNIAWSDLVLVSGGSLANDTLQALVKENPTVVYAPTVSGRKFPKMSLNSCLKKPTIFCGVTAAAAAHFLKAPRFCPYAT